MESKDSKYYVDKGVSIHPHWINSFESFHSHIGDMPDERKWSIDRIDPNGDYVPGNVRWALDTTQNRNRNKFSNNTSGDTGIMMRERNGSIRWIARWYDLKGKNCSKTFNESKYVNARQSALDYRNQMIAALNSQGADYPIGDDNGSLAQ